LLRSPIRIAGLILKYDDQSYGRGNDDVEADLRTTGIRRWRLIAKDRTEWAGIVREAKALQGP
jgi:hypothetical protein